MTLILCAGASTAAQAGSYLVSYSGGTVTTSNYSNSWPYTLNSSGVYGGSDGVGWGVNSASAVCSGTITATFTWQPSSTDDPLPTDVVIAETAFAVAGYVGSTPATKAEGDNSLGFPWNINTYNVSRHLNPPGGNCTGTRYSLKSNPGNTFTVTATPTATLTGAGSSSTPSSNGSVGVSYQATATPLEIVLSGGIGPRDSKSFLIGQQVTGTVSTGGLTASGFNWTISSGEPFKNWRLVWADMRSPTSAILEALETETQSQLTFHFRKAMFNGAQATVSTPIHLVVPSGAKPAAGFDTTLTRKCSVDKPSNTLAVWHGTVLGRPDPANPQGMTFDGASHLRPNGTTITGGIIWEGTVATPTAYGSGGGWNVTQLVNPSRVRCFNGVMQQRAMTGILALDSTFRYEPVFPSLYPNDGSKQGDRDAPSDAWDSGTSSFVVHDSFIDYTMYVPPGAGSCFVPLKNFNWFWQGQAQLNASGIWQLSNTDGSWSFVDDFPAHPTWSSNAGQGFNWVNQ